MVAEFGNFRHHVILKLSTESKACIENILWLKLQFYIFNVMHILYRPEVRSRDFIITDLNWFPFFDILHDEYG